MKLNSDQNTINSSQYIQRLQGMTNKIEKLKIFIVLHMDITLNLRKIKTSLAITIQMFSENCGLPKNHHL